MYPMSYAARDTLAANINSDIVMAAWRGTERLPFAFDVVDGSVSLTAGTGVRATMDATVTAERGLFDALAVWGVTVRVSWRHHHIDGTHEIIPLAVIDVDSARVSYGTGGDVIQFAGSDPWSRVIDAKFSTIIQPRGGLTSTAVRWIRDAVGFVPEAPLDQITGSDVRLSRQSYEDDRAAAITALLDSVGQEAFIYRDGSLVVRDVPLLTGMSSWSVRAGDGGVLVGAQRSRSRQGFYNSVIVRPHSPGQEFARYELQDTGATSPTRVRPGLYVPTFISDPRFRTRGQVERAARVHLSRGISTASSLELTTVPHPGIDPGDVISVRLPETDGVASSSERHLVESTTVSFRAGSQPITTRSSRPNDAGDEVNA